MHILVPCCTNDPTHPNICIGQGGSEQRIEVFVKIQKKSGWGVGVGSGGGGFRVDLNKEFKFL